MKNSMHMSSGDTRNVIIIPQIGLVFKFPRFDFRSGVVLFFQLTRSIYFCLYHLIMGNKVKWSAITWHLKHRIFAHYERRLSLGWFWFRGWFANINEARYYITQRDNPLLVPTYCSLFGFINVMPFVTPLTEDNSHTVYTKLCLIVEDKDELSNADGHAWLDKNFTQRPDETIALFDYASSRAFRLVKKYGNTLSKILIITK